jgi:hypothetical protein
MGDAAGLDAADRKHFLSLLKGLPQLPQMRIAKRGFALVDARAGYNVQVEVIDLDQSIFSFNGEVMYLNTKASFEEGVTKVEQILRRSSHSASLPAHLWRLAVPEAHAFVVALLAGAVAFAVAKIFIKDEDTSKKKKAKSSTFATEPEPVSTPNHAAAGTQAPANPNLGTTTETPVGTPQDKGNDDPNAAADAAKAEKAAEDAKAIAKLKEEFCQGDEPNGAGRQRLKEALEDTSGNGFTVVDGTQRAVLKGTNSYIIANHNDVNQATSFDYYYGDIKLCGLSKEKEDPAPENKDEELKEYCDDSVPTDKAKMLALNLWHRQYGTEADKQTAQKYLDQEYKDLEFHYESSYHVHPSDKNPSLGVFVDPDGKMQINFHKEMKCMFELPVPKPSAAATEPKATETPTEEPSEAPVKAETPVKTEAQSSGHQDPMKPVSSAKLKFALADSKVWQWFSDAYKRADAQQKANLKAFDRAATIRDLEARAQRLQAELAVVEKDFDAEKAKTNQNDPGRTQAMRQAAMDQLRRKGAETIGQLDATRKRIEELKK